MGSKPLENTAGFILTLGTTRTWSNKECGDISSPTRHWDASQTQFNVKFVLEVLLARLKYLQVLDVMVKRPNLHCKHILPALPPPLHPSFFSQRIFAPVTLKPSWLENLKKLLYIVSLLFIDKFVSKYQGGGRILGASVLNTSK